jgi:hypothetical protein
MRLENCIMAKKGCSICQIIGIAGVKLTDLEQRNKSDHRTTSNDNDETAVNVLDDGSFVECEKRETASKADAIKRRRQGERERET